MRLIIASLTLSLVACGGMPSGNDAGCEVTLTGAYPDTTFATAAANEVAMLGRLNAFSAPLRNAALDAGTTVTRAQLDALFTAGTPSLSTYMTPGFQATLDETLTAFIAAQGKTFTPANPATGTGGIYGVGTTSYVLSEKGVDLREVADKGFYGAVFYAEAAKRVPTATTPESIDQLVALFGANPTFQQSDTAAMGKDEMAAKYAKRRTPAGGPGSYVVIRDAFVRARLAATSSSAACSAERAAALETVKLEWERALASTVVFYVNSAATKLQDSAADATKKASALHDLGEGVGFFVGLKAVPQANRKITDAQLEQVLTAMRTPSISGSTLFRLVTDTPADVDSLLMANTRIQQAYGFTADEMTRFKTNY